MSVRQLNTVDTYTTAFNRATLEFTEAAGYAPRADELIWMCREGLKPQVKTFLAARGAITELKQLQEVALEIDATMYSSRINGISSSSSFRPHGQRSSHGHSHHF